MSHRGQDAHRGMVQAPLVAAAGWRFVPTFCDSRFRSFVSKSNPLSTTASATFRWSAPHFCSVCKKSPHFFADRTGFRMKCGVSVLCLYIIGQNLADRTAIKSETVLQTVAS